MVYNIQKNKTILLRDKRKIQQLFIDEIIYIKCEGNISTFYFNRNTKPKAFNKLLKHIEQELTNYGFIRINRNSIVNMKYINKINYLSRTVILQKNDVLIQISRRKLFEIKKNNRTILPLIC